VAGNLHEKAMNSWVYEVDFECNKQAKTFCVHISFSRTQHLFNCGLLFSWVDHLQAANSIVIHFLWFKLFSQQGCLSWESFWKLWPFLKVRIVKK